MEYLNWTTPKNNFLVKLNALSTWWGIQIYTPLAVNYVSTPRTSLARVGSKEFSFQSMGSLF